MLSMKGAHDQRNTRRFLKNSLFQTPQLMTSLTFSVSKLLPQRIRCNCQHSLYPPEEDNVITFELKQGKLYRQIDVQQTPYTDKNLLTLSAVTVNSGKYPDLAQNCHRITAICNKETHQKYFQNRVSPISYTASPLHL